MKYGGQAYTEFQRIFGYLPLAHIINNEVLVVHGGLPRKLGILLAEIEAVDRVAASRQREVASTFQDLLWSDPSTKEGFQPSQRGVDLVTFGPDATESFLEANRLQLVIRSHEVKQEGFEWQHGRKCLTVFSAPNYVDVCGNEGAVVKLKSMQDGTLFAPEIRPFVAAPRPPWYVPAMAYSPLSPLSRQFLSPSVYHTLITALQSRSAQGSLPEI